jgi:serine phosphatase RsbU (regulator of sigma subunit)
VKNKSFDILKNQKEIAESFKYASYIQNALLPSQSIIKKYIPEYFLLFLPRDIVSGDFYYLSQHKNMLYIAVADCTGHGVPGALMSILGLAFLNEIINNEKGESAAGILNIMREKVMQALKQTGDDEEQKDGIDIALGIINKESNNINFAGAFSPLYIIKKNHLLEIHGDKMPVGIAPDEEKPFTDHYLELEEGDMVYFFTDGYVDQFGGPEGKKFKYQPFRSLLLSISALPIHKQKEKLENTFFNWKGNLQQLDDVLILALRYHLAH